MMQADVLEEQDMYGGQGDIDHPPVASFLSASALRADLILVSGVYQQLLLIVEYGEPARLHFAALVHGTFNPHVPGHVGVVMD
jgi:hypothetical protein